MKRREFMKNAGAASVALSAVASTSAKAQISRPKYGSSSIELPDDIAGQLQFSQAEYDRRYAGLRSAMQEQGIDALLITGNREWESAELGNLQYVGVEKPDWERMYVVLPKDGKPIVPTKPKAITPGYRNHGVVDFEYVTSGLRPNAINSVWHAPGIVAALKKAGASNGTIGIVCPHTLPTDIYLAVSRELPKAKFVDSQMLMLNMRWYKSEEEIKFLRRSGYIADKGNEALINAVEVGVTEVDLWYAADKACAEAGGPLGGFNLMVSGPWHEHGPNMFFNHTQARTLEPGDILSPEVAGNYHSYITQITVPVSLGPPTDEFLKDLELCRNVYEHMATQFRPGKSTGELDKYGAEYVEDLTDGELTLIFAFQCGELERGFVLDDYEIRPGTMGYNQPYFVSTSGGRGWHVFGDAMVCTEDEPIRLSQSSMDVVIV